MTTEEGRGEKLARRVKKLGISARGLEKRTGVDRGTIGRALAGEPGVRSSTYDQLERAIADLEEEMAVEPGEEGRTVTFRISGNFGVDVVVQGPVENLLELEQAVGRLLSRMEDSEQTP